MEYKRLLFCPKALVFFSENYAQGLYPPENLSQSSGLGETHDY